MLFEKYQKYMQTLLAALEKRPMTWSALLNLWVGSGSNASQFSRNMQWMVSKGYVRKSDPANRYSTYEITQSGRIYLEGLKA